MMRAVYGAPPIIVKDIDGHAVSLHRVLADLFMDLVLRSLLSRSSRRPCRRRWKITTSKIIAVSDYTAAAMQEYEYEEDGRKHGWQQISKLKFLVVTSNEAYVEGKNEKEDEILTQYNENDKVMTIVIKVFCFIIWYCDHLR